MCQIAHLGKGKCCRRFIVLLLLLGGCFSPFIKTNSQELQKALNALSTDELTVLECFFRTLFAESQGGYVLYGDKPVCIEGFPIREEGTVFLTRWIHVFSTKLKEGAILWKKLRLNKYCKNYVLFVCEKPVFEKWIDLVLINKDELFRVVEANLPLFQYVLGPKVTPAGLFAKLIDPNETFYSVLRNDPVLIGILLGYGTQNALCGARSETIQETVSIPTFGFSTLHQETSWLEGKRSVSVDFSKEKIPPLPWFGCYEMEETGKLISSYRQAQKKIAKLLKSDRFLEKVLSGLFEEKVHLSPCLKYRNRPSFPMRHELTRVVAQGIWQCIDPRERDSEYIRAFCKGMKDSEEGTLPLSDSEYSERVVQFQQAKVECAPSDPVFLAQRSELAYYAGLRVWNHFKRGKDLYLFSDVMGWISQAQSGSSVLSPIDEQADEVLTRLHSVLYAKEAAP